MRRVVAVLIAAAIAISAPAAAFATQVDPQGDCWFNYVKCLSYGPYGVSADVHVKQRHPGAEYYLVSIQGKRAYDQAGTAIGWELTDSVGNNGLASNFRMLAHVVWPASEDDSYVWPSGAITENTYHNLRIERRDSTSSWWDLYLNGYWQAAVNWSYYGSSTTFATTQMETWAYNETGNPSSPVYSDAYFGHHKSYRIKAVNGAWYTLTSGWSVTPNQQDAPGGNDPGVSWANPFETQYYSWWYDWEGDL